MSRYYLRNSAGGVSGEDWGLLLSTGSQGSPTAKAVVIGGSPDTNTNYGCTAANDPNETDWDGTYTVTVDVSTGLNKTYGEVRLVRYNSSLVEQEEKTSTEGVQEWEIAQTYTYTFSSTTWSSPAASDRLALRFISSNDNHGTSTHYVDTEDTYVDTPWTAATQEGTANIAAATIAALQPTATGAGTATKTANIAAAPIAALQPTGTGAGTATKTAGIAAGTLAGLQPSAYINYGILIACGFEAGVEKVTPVDYFDAAGTITAIEVQSTTVFNGDYALRVFPATTETAYAAIRGVNTAGAWVDFSENTLYVDFRMRVKTAPSASSNEQFCVFYAWSPVFQRKADFRLSPDGSGNIKLALHDKDGTLITTGTTTLNTDTWYRISIKVGTESAEGNDDAPYEMKIDGSTEFSGTGDLSAEQNDRVMFGKYSNQNSNDVEIFYDDIVISNTGWLPDCVVTRMDIDSNGAETGWTASAGNKNECIDDVNPGTTEEPDDDSTYIYSSDTADYYTAGLETAASAGVTGTVYAVQHSSYVRGESTSASLRVYTRYSGTNDYGGAQTETTSYRGRNLVFATAPGGGAWSTSILDSTEIGFNPRAATYTIRVTYGCLMVIHDAPSTLEGTCNLPAGTLTALQPTATGSGTATKTAGQAVGTIAGLQPTATGAGTASATAQLAAAPIAGLQPTATGAGTVVATANIAAGTMDALQPTATMELIGNCNLPAGSIDALQPTATGAGTVVVTATIAAATLSGLQPGATGAGAAAGSAQLAAGSIDALQPTAAPAGAAPVTAQIAAATVAGLQPTATGAATATATANQATALIDALQTTGQLAATNAGRRSANADWLVVELQDPDGSPTWVDRATMCGCYAGIAPGAPQDPNVKLPPEELGLKWGGSR